MRNMEDLLFSRGIELFNSKDFYGAHESWEELWTDYKMSDSLFVQGLIQLSVGFYHIDTDNINGARGLFKKTIPKIGKYRPIHRGIDIEYIFEHIEFIYKHLLEIQNLENFNDNMYFRIKYDK